MKVFTIVLYEFRKEIGMDSSETDNSVILDVYFDYL